MVSKVFQAGHAIVVEHQDDEKVIVTGIRFVGERELTQTVAFTIEMANRAGLANKSNWKKYPEAMLYWRAVSQLCRQFFPDVLGGLRYLPDDLGDAEWTEEPWEDEQIEGQAVIEYDDEADPERPFE